MRREIVVGQKFLADQLRPDIRVNILALLAYDHFLHNGLRSQRIADAHAGGNHLGEGTGVKHKAVLVQRLDRRDLFARKAQVAVWIILQNQHAVPFGQLVNTAALFGAHRDAGGILEIRNGVNEFRFWLFAQGPFQLGKVDAVGFHGNAAQAHLIGTEGIQRADEARRLADHNVPRVAQGLCRQIHYLLRPRGDQHIVKIASRAVLLFHISSERPAQRRIPFGYIIL